MANFCVPKAVSQKFSEAIKSKQIDPDKLRKATSEERRLAFTPVFGEEMAKEVNALFESKLLLKDQKEGLLRWANTVKGIPEARRNSIIDQINGLNRVLDPRDKNRFLQDLAEQKLGVKITQTDAKELADLSRAATTARLASRSDIGNIALQEAYGSARQALVEKYNQLKGNDRFNPKSWESWGNLGLEVLGAPKAVLSSIDFSAPMVQGWGMLSTKQWWTGIWPMIKYFAKEENYFKLNSQILGHPYYDLAMDGKLGITSIEQPNKIGAREESFQSHLIERLVQHVSDFSKEQLGFGLPNAFRASDRAFTGFINHVRFYRFVDLVNAAKMSGENVALGSQVLKDLAKAVNDFTGRGNIGRGDSLSHLGPILNNVFFSARKQSATISMFNPLTYAASSPTARKAALRQLLGSVTATASVMMLAKMAGADIVLNPEAQNFLQIRLPGSDTYFDVTGTNGNYLRLIGRLVTGKTISSSGKENEYNSGFGSGSRADELIGYVRGKLAPTASIIANALYGEDPVGRPFDLTDDLSRNLVPMTIGSYIDMANSEHETSLSELASLTATFGVGMRPVYFHPSAYGYNIWGNPDTLISDPETEALNTAANDANYRPRLPPKTLNGEKLTKAQHQEYLIDSGLISKQLLLPLIQGSSWKQITPEEQAQTMRELLGAARTIAATNLQAKYPEILINSINKQFQTENQQ